MAMSKVTEDSREKRPLIFYKADVRLWYIQCNKYNTVYVQYSILLLMYVEYSR